MDLSGKLGKKAKKELGRILGPTKATGLLRLLSDKGCNPEDISINGGSVTVTVCSDKLGRMDHTNLQSYYGFSAKNVAAEKGKKVFYKRAV